MKTKLPTLEEAKALGIKIPPIKICKPGYAFGAIDSQIATVYPKRNFGDGAVPIKETIS